MAKTGPQCRICHHADRHLIELGMCHRVPARVLAKRFNITEYMVQWHKKYHLTPQLKAALLTAQRPTDIDLEALERRESESLLANLVAQRARLQLLSELAFEEHELHVASSVERCITGSLELTAKLLGQLVQVPPRRIGQQRDSRLIEASSSDPSSNCCVRKTATRRSWSDLSTSDSSQLETTVATAWVKPRSTALRPSTNKIDFALHSGQAK